LGVIVRKHALEKHEALQTIPLLEAVINWQSLFGSSVVCVIIVKDAMTPLLIPKLRVSILSSRKSIPSWPSPLGLSRLSKMQNRLQHYT